MSAEPIYDLLRGGVIDTRILAAEAAKAEGMATAEAAADPRIMLAVDRVIEEAIASGQPWDANSIRDRLPVTSSGLVGARVRSYAARTKPRLIVAVGRTRSTLRSTKAKDVTVWQAVGAVGGGS